MMLFYAVGISRLRSNTTWLIQRACICITTKHKQLCKTVLRDEKDLKIMFSDAMRLKTFGLLTT